MTEAICASCGRNNIIPFENLYSFHCQYCPHYNGSAQCTNSCCLHTDYASSSTSFGSASPATSARGPEDGVRCSGQAVPRKKKSPKRKVLAKKSPRRSPAKRSPKKSPTRVRLVGKIFGTFKLY